MKSERSVIRACLELLSFLLAEQIQVQYRSGRSWTLRRRRGHRSARFFYAGPCRLSLLTAQEFSGIEQRPVKRGVLAGPRSLEFRLALEVGTHCLHLGVQIVEIVQHKRFREHRQLGRSKVVLPVMADDH